MARETRVQSQVALYQRLKKKDLKMIKKDFKKRLKNDIRFSLLNTSYYKFCIKGKVEQLEGRRE